MPIYAKAVHTPYVVTTANVKQENDYPAQFHLQSYEQVNTPAREDTTPNTHYASEPSPRSQSSQPAHINNRQIIKTACEWFESWRPWQQKLVLCGITNRCSTGQLESLATTLEPIFHRDFRAAFQHNYPLAVPISKQSKKNKKAKGKPQQPNRQQGQENYPTNTDTGKKTPLPESDSVSNLSREMTRSETELLEKLTVLEKEIAAEEKENDFTKKINAYAEKITSNILDDIVSSKEEEEDTKSVDEFVDRLVVSAMSEALASLETVKPDTPPPTPTQTTAPTINFSTNILGNLNLKNLSEENNSHHQEETPPPSPTQTTIPTVNCSTNILGNLNLKNLSEENKSHHQEEKSTHIPHPPKKRVTNAKIRQSKSIAGKTKTSPRSRKTEMFMRDGGSVSKHQNSLARHPQTPGVRSGRSRNQTPLPSTAVSRRSLESALLHRHRSAQGSAALRTRRSVDFFKREWFAKLGPMQAELRSGNVKRPIHVQDLFLPMQKMYKNAKWFSDEPLQGNTFVKPTKSALQQAYTLQTKQLYKWIEAWEDHHRQTLLVEIIKMCSPSLVNYLGQCLFERMKERIDINWLSDHLLLLVFSNLSLEDIDSCSQVCKRWRHLCACDELWMYKCHEFGCEIGVPNMIEKVQSSVDGDSQIDWRIALMEVRDIVLATKDIKPGLNDLASLVATPSDMVRIDGRFIPEDKAPTVETPIEEVLVTQVEEPPRKGLAARLRMESEKLRQMAEMRAGVSSKIEQRAARQGSSGSDSSRNSDELWTAREKNREKLLSRAGLASKVSQSMGGKDDGNAPKGSSQGSRVDSWLQEGPLRVISSRKKGADNDGEKALDVRPDLVQQPDLLSPEGEENTEGKAVKRPVGKVEAIKRCRKFMGHMDSVLCVAFGTRRLISGSMDRSVRIWDIRSGQSIHKLYGHKGGVSCLLFEKDVLFTGSWDMAVMVWNLVTFERIGVLTGHRGSVSCLAINEKYIFSGSHDTTVRVWGRKNMTIRKVIRGHTSHVLCLAIDGDLLITGSSDKTIRITDIEQEECLNVFTGSNDPIHRLTMKGGLILSANTAGQVWFWNKESGKAEAAIQAHKNLINAIVFRDGRFFTASSDMTIKEWDLYSLTCVRSLQGHKSAINGMAASDQRIVSCSSDGHIRVWDFFTPLQLLGESPDEDIPTQVIHQQAS